MQTTTDRPAAKPSLTRSLLLPLGVSLALAGTTGCGDEDEWTPTPGPTVDVPNPLATPPDGGPPAGNLNAEATCGVPPEAGLADSSNPTTVIGAGTPDSCTSQAVVEGVAQGGVITFDYRNLTPGRPPGSVKRRVN